MVSVTPIVMPADMTARRVRSWLLKRAVGDRAPRRLPRDSCLFMLVSFVSTWPCAVLLRGAHRREIKTKREPGRSAAKHEEQASACDGRYPAAGVHGSSHARPSATDRDPRAAMRLLRVADWMHLIACRVDKKAVAARAAGVPLDVADEGFAPVNDPRLGELAFRISRKHHMADEGRYESLGSPQPRRTIAVYVEPVGAGWV